MIRVNVDPTNPGQFFACCGLLELADRLWPGAEGWFEKGCCEFCLNAAGSLSEIIAEVSSSELATCVDEGESSIHPVIVERFNLKLNWWLRSDWSRYKNVLV